MNRNRYLEWVKLVASFSIVLLHTEVCTTPLNNYFLGLTRWAVPFFFALMGSRLFKGDLTTLNIRHSCKDKIVKYIKIFLWVNAFYLVFSFVSCLLNKYTITEWINRKFNWYSLFSFLFFDDSYILTDKLVRFAVLWYILAVIRLCLFIYFIAPLLKYIYKGLTIVFFIVSYSMLYLVRDRQLCTLEIRWIILAPLCIFMGIWFAESMKHKFDTLTESDRIRWMDNIKYKAIYLQIFGAMCTIIETYIFGRKELYIGSLLIVIGILFLSKCDLNCSSIIDSFRAVPANTYYFHTMFLVVLNMYLPQTVWYKVFIVFGFCVVLFVGLDRLKGVKINSNREVKSDG